MKSTYSKQLLSYGLNGYTRIGFGILLVFQSGFLCAQDSGGLPPLRKDDKLVRGQPYERYFTTDKFGREITFYLSEEQEKNTCKPLVVYIQGSGCSSLFVNRNEQIVGTGGHSTVRRAAENRARILIVEKPGVSFLHNKPNCRKNTEFNREHTLDRWATAVAAAITATQQHEEIEKANTLVIGHSEGGIVAARVSKMLPETVSHVAILAGEGPSQLFSLMTLTREGVFFKHISDDPNKRVQYVLDQWKLIQAEPDSSEKFFFGFAFRRWSSFLSTSPMEELEEVGAKIYLAQGQNDKAVDPVTADVMYAHLVSKGKTVVLDRVKSADHSFNLSDQPQIDGWHRQHKKVIDWFLEN